MCSDEDWYAIDLVGGNIDVTVCARFVHAEGDIDIEAYSQVTIEPEGILGDAGARLGVSATKNDVERFVFQGDSAPQTVYLRVFLDAPQPVNTEYALHLLEGIVDPCP